MNKLNKRILSALLAFILLMTNFPVISSASDTFAITYEGENVTQVEFYEHDRITVTAENNPGDAYQWQIKIPNSEQWVNIQGQTSQTINLSKAVVGSLSVEGVSYVRCAALSSGTEVDHTTDLCVTVKEDERVVQIPAVQTPDAPAVQEPASTEPVPAETEPVPAETEPVPAETEVPVEATEIPEEIVEIPAETEEIPAETAASTEPEAEVVVTAPAADPSSEPVEEIEIPDAAEEVIVEETEVVIEETEAPVEVVIEETEAPTEAEESEELTFIEKVAQFFAPRTGADDSTETEIVTVTIYYRAVDRKNKFEKTQEDATVRENAADAEDAVDPYVAHIFKSSDLQTTIPCHVIAGYELTMPSFAQDGIQIDPTNKNNLSVNLTSVPTDLTFYVYYKEVEVPYSARYFKQNVYNDLYVEDVTVLTPEIQENMKGYPGDEPNTSIIYPNVMGFTALFFQPDTIAADGSTIFEVYYDRNYYLMNFNMDGGYGTPPVYARYGTTFTVPAPTQPGHTFIEWTETHRDINTNGSNVEDPEYVAALAAHMATIPLSAHKCVTKVPFSNLTYMASWDAAEAPYKVAYWLQDSNGKNTYLGNTIQYAPSEKEVSGSNNLTSTTPLCNSEGHTHTDDCISCGHMHTSSCYGNLDSVQLPPDATRLAAIKSLGKNEPEIGYIYAVDYPLVDNGKTWYNLYSGNNWHCWHLPLGQLDAMVSGTPLKTTTYTDSEGNPHEVRKYHAIWSNCTANPNHVHGSDCVVTCKKDEHIHGNDCYCDTSYMEYITADTQVVKGDGSTIVNVYYKYKEYTLKFYYAYSKTTNGTTTYHVVGGSSYPYGGTNTNDSMEALKMYSHGGETGQCGQVDELPKLNATGIARYSQNIPQNATYDVVTYTENDQTYTYNAPYVSYQQGGTTYKWYYVTFTARFNDNIANLWPADVIKSVTRTSANTHADWSGKEAFVSAWNGEHHVLYTQKNPSAQTIKGVYQTLDENLLWKSADWYGNGTSVVCDKNGEIDFLCFWDNGADISWSIPSLFRYYTYVETIPGEAGTKTFNGKSYKQLGTYLDTVDNYEYNAYDPNYSVNKQTATDLFGYTNVGRTSDMNVDLPADQSSLYQYKYNVYFFYDSNVHALNFWNHNGWLNSGDGVEGGVAYGASLTKYFEGTTYNGIKYDGANDIVQYPEKYPTGLEPSAYYFDGWYTTPDCLPGTRVVWETMIMPDADLTVYAKWEPVKYDTYFYMDYDRYLLGKENAFFSTSGTPHGTNITADLQSIRNLKFKDAEGNINDQYLFVNWFYIDTDGTQKAFNPHEMAIRKELHLFAEWTSKVVKEYTVSYQQGVYDNNENKYVAVSPVFTMAEDSKGYALEATTKTFTALSKDELVNFPDNSENQLWLPNTNSHSIVMQADNNDNAYTFLYVRKDNAPYIVRYLDAETNKPIYLDNDGNEIVGGKTENTDAIVTERFKYIEDYIPDAFHKRLILSANDAENVITFYYTKDESISGGDVGSGGVGGGEGGGEEGGENPGHGSARYLIVHHYPKMTGTGYDDVYDSDVGYVGYIGTSVTATEQQYPGFVFDETTTREKAPTNQTVENKEGLWTISGVITSGEDEGANKPLELHLYYTRQTYPYTVRYLDWDTKNPLPDNIMPAESGTALFDSIVTKTAQPISGYDLYDAGADGTKTLELTISWNENSNIMTFYYIKKKIKVEYKSVCTDPNITSGFGGVSNSLDYDKTTPTGSQAAPASGFYFKGWYTDWGTANSKFITANRLLEPSNISIIPDVYDYTYYAVFEPITLTISQTNMHTGDSAVYEVLKNGTPIARVMLTGNDSVTLQAIPAGDYTVQEVTHGWTWTYANPASTPTNGVITVEAGQNNAITFDYAEKYDGSCWLHNETHR